MCKSKYCNVTCLIKIISIFHDGPFDEGSFYACVDICSLHIFEECFHLNTYPRIREEFYFVFDSVIAMLSLATILVPNHRHTVLTLSYLSLYVKQAQLFNIHTCSCILSQSHQ